MAQRTTFEVLPNELILDIFEHLPVEALFKTFTGLNSRLTTIIDSVQTFHFQQRQSENIDDSAFADRVTTLTVRHSDPIDLSHYSNLQVLQLEWPTQQQCNQVIMHQSQLKHLYIGHPSNEYHTEQLLRHVFTNGFPQLCSCRLENIRPLNEVVSAPSTILSTLRSIKILTAHSHDLIRLLSLCPNLRRLSIKFFAPATADLHIFKQWLPLPHENLRTLVFDSVSFMSIEAIDSILTFVPNLTNLSIKNPRGLNEAIDVQQIADSLYQHASRLSQFYAIIWLDDLNSYYVNNINVIQSLHPLFNHVQLSPGRHRLIISSSLH